MYGEYIMAECNKHIHMGWLYDEHGGENIAGMTIVNSDTRSGHCLAEPRIFFYSSDVYNLPLASAK